MQKQQQTLEQKPKREYNFKPGRSGNPAGRRGSLERFNRLVAELMAELGGDVPPSKRILVEQLVRLKVKAKVDDVRTRTPW
jgi:hypothetical protein